MVSLVDIAPQQTQPVKPVTLAAGQEVPCRPLSMREIALLLQRFPALGAFVGGGGAADLVSAVPPAIGAIIAVGTGNGDNPAEEEAAAILPLDDQLALLEKIMALTMPSGIVPFVERLTMLLGVSRSANAGKGPVTNLPPPSSS